MVIVLDVGKTMSEGPSAALEGGIKAVSLLVQQKLLYRKRDEVALVLCGTEDSLNDLTEQGYQHITVVRELETPDIELLRLIEDIHPEGASGDVIDALIVGLDLLNKKTRDRRYQRRLFLVTDAGCAINTEDLDLVLTEMNSQNVRFNVVGVNFMDEEDLDEALKNGKPSTKLSNEKLLYEIASRTEGVVLPAATALDAMSQLRSQGVLQRTSYRGFLEISKFLCIPVWCFLKTREAKFPSLKKISAVSEQCMCILIL